MFLQIILQIIVPNAVFSWVRIKTQLRLSRLYRPPLKLLENVDCHLYFLLKILDMGITDMWIKAVVSFISRNDKSFCWFIEIKERLF